jgi:hypothetical protein
MSTRRHRSRAIADRLIALSIAYERHDLAARGHGLEHLRELLMRLARPLIRQGASLAFGGFWRKTDDNFTYELLGLISAEQEENTLGGPDTSRSIGWLVNHSAWPDYLDITPATEAQWVNCCRIVRVSQKDAGLASGDIVPDSAATSGSDRAVFNAAVTLSAARRFVMDGMSIVIPDVGTDAIAPAGARVVLGGKVTDYRGFAPGIFEEALLTLERQRPLYLLGGFGGAAEVLADALLAPPGTRPEEMLTAWHREKTPGVSRLGRLLSQFALPPAIRPTEVVLDSLHALIEQGRADLPGTLQTGLDATETRELLTTRDVARVVQLVRRGLETQIGLQTLPA